MVLPSKWRGLQPRSNIVGAIEKQNQPRVIGSGRPFMRIGRGLVRRGTEETDFRGQDKCGSKGPSCPQPGNFTDTVSGLLVIVQVRFQETASLHIRDLPGQSGGRPRLT